jgi:type I restriction-modification system DNA methylase subunit
MPLFQKSIVKKHINSENQEVLKEKWKLFTSYFHNATIQENIHNSKEEQFQEGFLRELFVKILGYTLNPEPNFNLTTEYKNIKDSKKADGAIIINNIVTAVIELKGTGTTDLGKVESQAFNYKNNQHQCVYVITSNFEKLRFYIDNAIEHIEFNLFKLTEEEFQLLYLCLAFKNIENNVPKNIKDESVSQEDVITKKLYNDYSLFKRELHQNLVALNPDKDPLVLFQKSQKLLDRFLFIFFAEDRALLPTNLIFRINKEWQQLREMRIEVSLYERYKIYFSDLNIGAKVSLPAFSQTVSNKKDEFQIYAYNGGLFKEDEALNALKIDDALLFKHTEKLSNYDFASEVDVNILGHIFENSLNELDEIKAQLEGQVIDKTKTKRKKDGVFYTPKYITKYIVDNTVGKLCNDKKAELKIIEEEFITDKKCNKTSIQALATKLTDYRNWLLQITICDPACGSGAFLNQALDFLINEHKYIDELQAKLFGDAIVLSDVEGSILENNIFGVDINEESVEIAKLSLWLRTAQPNRKLNDLNSNIKCGNSLIDDVAIAGEKAFDWHNSFPKVFEKGGFDVIIGNPPYVNVELMPVKDKEYYKAKYATFFKRTDLFSVFLDMATHSLTKDGFISFIIPSIILNNLSYSKIRDLLLDNNWLSEVCYTGGGVFLDVTVDTVILVIRKSLNENIKLVDATDFFNSKIQLVESNYFKKFNNSISITSADSNTIYDKLFNPQFLQVGDNFNVFQGIVTGNNESYVFESQSEIDNANVDNELLHPLIGGKDIGKWVVKNNAKRILYVDQKIDIDSFVNTKKWLLQFKEILEKRRECVNGAIPWYSLQWARDKEEFNKRTKIILQRTRNESLKTRIVATIDETGVFGMESLIFLTPKKDNLSLHYIICILNSTLINYLFATKFLNLSVKGEYLKQLSFPVIENELQFVFIEKAKTMLSSNNILQDLSQKFHRTLERKFGLKEISNKLQEFYLLTYNEFIKELAKKKIKLSLAEEAEWEEYFNTEAKKALELKSKIDATDKEIDQMVYRLYDLTEEEIKIVEGN